MDLVARRTTRRSFVALLGLALAGCAAPASPAPASGGSAAPTTAPAAAAKPTEVPAKPAAPAATAAPAAASGAGATDKVNLGQAVGGDTGARIDKAMDQLYQAAKASGQLKITHYGSPDDSYKPAIETFQKRFAGMEVETVLLRGPEMTERLNAEAASGKLIANVGGHGETTMSGLEKLGRMLRWEPVGTERLPKPELPSDSQRWMYTVGIFGVVYNSDKVLQNRLPKGRKDLLDPYWKGKGKLYTEDPRGAGPGQSFWVITYDDLGEDYLKAMKAQEMTFTRNRDAAPSQVARGEFDIYWPVGLNDEMQNLMKSSALKTTFFKDGGAHYDNTTVGVIKDGPAQDAAKLWVQWLISDEGQRTLAEKVKVFPVVAGMPGPPGWPSYDEIKPRGRSADQRLRNDEYIKKFEQLFFS